MGLPDFLVIGAQRSGTTWLYNIFKTHKKIALAEGRKEVHYFDRYYDRGLDWYKNLFPDKYSGKMGEITPAYLYHKECSERIKQDLPDIKLICILRNPIDRAYSGYKYIAQEIEPEISFKRAIDKFPDIIERGLYFQQLERYNEYFENNQMRIVLFDDLTKTPEKLINSLCDYLEINYEYDKNFLRSQFNKSGSPKYPFLYHFVKKIVRKMYDYDKIKLINILKKMELKDNFFIDSDIGKQKNKQINEELFQKLKMYYSDDVKNLSDLLDINLNVKWKI